MLSGDQICELWVDLLFTNHGMDVQDPRIGQLLGIGRKVRRMFEVQNKFASFVVHFMALSKFLELGLKCLA